MRNRPSDLAIIRSVILGPDEGDEDVSAMSNSDSVGTAADEAVHNSEMR